MKNIGPKFGRTGTETQTAVSKEIVRRRLGVFTFFVLAGCGSAPTTRNATDSEQKIKVASILNCNKLVRYMRPVYPQEARRKRIEGIVTLAAIITKTGELRDLEVIKGDSALSAAAVSAVKQWRYTPCFVDSNPVEIKTTLDIDFNLKQ